MLMQALRPWINHDREGVVHPGQQFEAHGLRATELRIAGLAVPVVSETEKIKVVADKPAALLTSKLLKREGRRQTQALVADLAALKPDGKKPVR